jgi:N4-gp56 family major capsid protein
MGMTDYAANDAMAVKLWSRMLSLQSLDSTDIKPLIGDDENSIIQMKDETSKGPGDQVTYGLQIQLQGAGFTENDTAEGNGESLATFSDALTINELGHVVGVKPEVTIDAQRVPFNARAQARMGLKDWWSKRYSVSFFNVVCGNTAQTDTKFTGLSTPTAPTSTGNRLIRQNSRTTDELVVAGDVFTLDLVDKAKEQAIAQQLDSNNNPTIPRIRPVNIGGRELYVMYLDDTQITDMRTNTGTGQWLDITKRCNAGRPETKSAIFSGALGEYNGVVFRRTVDLPKRRQLDDRCGRQQHQAGSPAWRAGGDHGLRPASTRTATCAGRSASMIMDAASKSARGGSSASRRSDSTASILPPSPSPPGPRLTPKGGMHHGYRNYACYPSIASSGSADRQHHQEDRQL